MADGGRIPRVVVEPSALRALRLSAADGFILSRIDGRAGERELASLTGLPDSQVRTSLETLLSLKVISFSAPPVVSQSSPAMQRTASGQMRAVAPPPADSAPRLPPAEPSAPAPAATKPASALLEEAIARIPEDAPELQEEVDLALDLRRRVLGLHSVMSSLDHYAILGIARDVDKKAVKRSYFELAALFHPDRYFRKNLGSFKARMEVVFAKVSVAYETLADKTSRAEYDLYLGDVENSRNVEAMLRNVMAEVEQAQQTAMEMAGSAPVLPATDEGEVARGESSGLYTSSRPPARAASNPPAPEPAAAPKNTAASDRLRKEALAMRLRGIRPPTKPAAAPVPQPEIKLAPPPPHANTAEAVDALKRRYEERVEIGRRQQGDKYVKIGELAESRNDLTAAAAAYRVALTFLHDEDASYAHAREVIAKSEAQLGETYTRQAEHEERANRWEDALRSWTRAVKLRPNDHRVTERYAYAILKNSGDLHEASQAAQKAVALAPTVGDYRVTLANIYLAAGLMLNARRELETAAQQFPENPNIAAMLKKLAKPA